MTEQLGGGGVWTVDAADHQKALAEIERLRAALDEVGRLADFGWGTTGANEALKKIQVLSAALEHPPTLTPHNDWEVVSGRGGPRQRCRICGWLGLPVEASPADETTARPSTREAVEGAIAKSKEPGKWDDTGDKHG